VTDTSGFFDTQAGKDVPRDRYGRYLLPDETGQDTGWTRATTFAATLAESYGLRIWEQRQVVWGLSRRPDLLTLASTIVGPEDKKALGAIVDSAHEAAGTQAKANMGTAIHEAIASVERSGSWEHVPDALRGDVDGYFRELAKRRIQVVPEFIERTCIIPAFKVAGTFDNIVRCPDGQYRILDKKTGNLDYAEIEFAVQMALYANATALRNYDNHTYEPMPEVAKDYAIIAHVVPGSGRTTLHRINIRWGWAWAATCAEVQDIRKTKHVLTPYVDDSVTAAPTHDNPALAGNAPFVPTPPAPVNHAQVAALAIQGFANAASPVVNMAPDADFWDTDQDEDAAPTFVATPVAQVVAPGSAPAVPSVPSAPAAPAASAAAAQTVAGPGTGSPALAAAVPVPSPPTASAAGAEPAVDPETEAEELVRACKGKAKLQAIARDIMAQASEASGGATITETSPGGIKLSQHQIKIARGVIALKNQYGLTLPDLGKPRKVDPAAETEADVELTNHLKYIRTMPTIQGLVEYQRSIGDRWTDEHQEAARVRAEQINQQAAGPVPLTPAQIIAGATSVESLAQAWRVATNNGADKSAWPEGGELDLAAKAKTAELGGGVATAPV